MEAYSDRHMRNFGVIRSTKTAKVPRLAPNFDNNQAYLGNPGGYYSAAMLKSYWRTADHEDRANLRQLLDACKKSKYLEQAWKAGMEVINSTRDNSVNYKLFYKPCVFLISFLILLIPY